jgi:NTP pyrophosphatase (non-canonical NTP hydrolase)
MDNKLQELLTIVMEECGELIQACSKAIRCDDYYDNKKLLEEVGDVYCMIELLHKYDLISWSDIEERVKVKKKKLKKWSSLDVE